MSREQRAINRRNKLESLLSRGGDGPKRDRKTRFRRLAEKLLKCELFNLKFLVLPIVAYIALIKHSQLSCIMFVKSDEECQVAVENLEKNQCAIEEERFGEVLYDGEVPTFVEKSFGYHVGPGEVHYRTSDNVRDLSSIVVSLALFDGNCAPADAFS